MNKSIYTEYANLTPYNIKWLDECGMKSGSGKSFSNIRFMGDWDSVAVIRDNFNYSPKEFYASMNYTHLPTGDAFCQGVAEILGIEYVPEVTKTETVTEDKGLAIKYSLLSPDQKKWLDDEIEQWEPLYDYIFLNHNKELDSSKLDHIKKYRITTDPIEFMRYVAEKTGKEWVPNEVVRAIETIESMSPSYPHKAYRVLDSLDSVPFDTRIPLSEWVPTFGVDLIFIDSVNWTKGKLDSVIIDPVRGGHARIKEESQPNLQKINLDGHWMRIV